MQCGIEEYLGGPMYSTGALMDAQDHDGASAASLRGPLGENSRFQ